MWKRILCFSAVCALIFGVCGCSAFTPEKNRRRAYVVKADLEHLIDDVDWILGFDKPSMLYED